jgi:hypothetical protein
MISKKMYIAIGILVIIAFIALTGKGSSQQDQTLSSVPTVVPGQLNAPNVLAPGHQVIAGPLVAPDGGIIYILDNGEAREIM